MSIQLRRVEITKEHENVYAIWINSVSIGTATMVGSAYEVKTMFSSSTIRLPLSMSRIREYAEKSVEHFIAQVTVRSTT